METKQGLIRYGKSSMTTDRSLRVEDDTNASTFFFLGPDQLGVVTADHSCSSIAQPITQA